MTSLVGTAPRADHSSPHRRTTCSIPSLVTMSFQGAPAKPDGFTCSTCQRVTPVCVWQGVKIGSRNVTWMLCRECFGRELRAEEGSR